MYSTRQQSKEFYVFTGWVGTDITDKEMALVIPAGSVGNRVYGATYTEGSTFIAISKL